MHKYEEAKPILLGAAKLNRFHAPEIDLLLAEIYFQENNSSVGRAYLRKAQMNKLYLGGFWKPLLKKLTSEDDHNGRRKITIFVLIVAAIAAFSLSKYIRSRTLRA